MRNVADNDSANGRHPRELPLTLIFLGFLAAVLLGYQKIHPPDPMINLGALALWLAVFGLACFGPGAILWRRLGDDPLEDTLARWVICSTLGAGLLAAAAFVLGALHILNPVPLVLVLLLSAALGLRELRGNVPALREIEPVSSRTAAALLFFAGVVTLLAVPTLSSFYDQWNYQLAFPFRWLREGRLVTFPRHGYSYFPANMGLLYTYALSTFGGWAAQAVHWWMGLLTVLGVAALAGRIGKLRGRLWAAAIFATTPSVMLTATVAGADLGVSACAVSGWLLLLTALRSRKPWSPRLWFLCGAMAGLAAGCKYLALATVAIPLFAGVLLFLSRGPGGPEDRRNKAAALLSWAGGALLLFSPWMIRNILAAGNPFYPYLGSFFKTAGALPPVRLFHDATSGGGGLPPALRAVVRALTLRTFSPEGFAGLIGPVYLILLPVAVIWAVRRRETGPRLLLAGTAGGILLWSFFPQLGRYLLPVLAIAAALAGPAVESLLSSWTGWPSRLLRLSLLGILAWAFFGGCSYFAAVRGSCTLGAYDNGKILTEYVSYWPAISWMNEELPEQARILFVGESRSFLVERSVTIEDPYQTPLLVELAEQSGSGREMAARLKQMGVTHVLINYSEAARIAWLNKRPSYFSPLSPAGQRNLDDFFRGSLRAVKEAGPVTILELQSP
jgi:hypothetical protein